MRKIFAILGIVFCTNLQVAAQNVGIGTTTPQTKLDINGDIALRSADLTISTTYTYALDVNSVKQSNYKLKQPILPIGNFVLAGIAAGVEGRLITLTNRTSSSMEIYNEDVNATAANRIQTGTGNTVAIYPNGNVTLQYDATDQRWSIKSMHNNSLNYFGGGAGGSSYWDLSGQNISNTNTGNVGIGLTNPSRAKLEINGVSGTGSTSAIMGGDGAGISFQRNWPTIGFNQYRDAPDGWGKAIASGYGAHMFLNPDAGNFALVMQDSVAANIGFVATPIAALSIFKNGKMHIGNNNISDQASLSISGVDNCPSHFNFGSDGHTYIRGGRRENRLIFKPSKVFINDITGYNTFTGTTSAGGDVLIATGGGKVGINTDAPTSPLSFPNVLGKKISFWNAGINSDFGIGIQSGEMQFYTAGQDIISFGYGSSGSYNRSMAYYPGTAQLGINCLPQNGYHLSVNGYIKSKEIVVELANWADYVFDKNYPLKPLSEVENFIKENKHLPNIPSALDIESDGLKVGDIQKRMMEKIEELTLYVIELKKEIDLLKSNK